MSKKIIDDALEAGNEIYSDMDEVDIFIGILEGALEDNEYEEAESAIESIISDFEDALNASNRAIYMLEKIEK